MSSRSEDKSTWTHYRRGLGISTRNNTIAYGYSVGLTATFGVLQQLHRSDVARMFVFIAGASIPFAIVNAIVTRGYRSRFADEPGVVIALATSLSILSVSVAVGCATLVAWAAPAWLAWLCAPFTFSVVYLLSVGAETALAAAQHRDGGAD